MRKPDDCSLSAGERAKVRAEAERALKEAGAFGIFPTPVDRIMAVANVEEVKDHVLDEGFLAKMRSNAGGAIKSALTKVLGLFYAKDGLVFLDHKLQKVRKTSYVFISRRMAFCRGNEACMRSSRIVNTLWNLTSQRCSIARRVCSRRKCFSS